MANEAVEQKAYELLMVLSSASRAVLQEAAEIVARQRGLGHLTSIQHRSLRKKLRALGWKP